MSGTLVRGIVRIMASEWASARCRKVHRPNVARPFDNGSSRVETGPEMLSLLAVTLGAVIALAATLGAEALRARSEHARVLARLRYDCYLEFLVANVRATDALRAVCVSGQATPTGVVDAMRGSGLYIARERLIATGSPAMVLAGETAFRSVLDMRDAVADGKVLDWPDFRPANDGIAKEAWTLRQAARTALGGVPLDLDQIQAIQSAGIVERLRGPGDQPR